MPVSQNFLFLVGYLVSNGASSNLPSSESSES